VTEVVDEKTGNKSASRQPPLYQKPVAISVSVNAEDRLISSTSFDFASQVSSLPLAAVEFTSAARSYPIVFSPNPPFSPLCITGIRSDENLFVDSNGQWERNTYIPAYVRRFPFLLLNDGKSDKMVLGIETTAKRLSKTKGETLFQKSEPSPFLNQALAFCTDYNRQWEASLAMAETLNEHGLLIEETSELPLPNKQKLRLGGFKVIDEAKLNNLPTDTFIEWRDRGWLGPIYAHMASIANWPFLVYRANAASKVETPAQ
jgi:hypothetical protein